MLHMIKIVSGGQTGVDRAALDAALELGIECGGWCPAGRRAEDGRIPERYPLTELANAGYRQRTIRNIDDSDGTAVIYFGFPTGGTELTIAMCIQRKRPYLLIDATELTIERSAQRIVDFISQNHIHTLNIAGPRASGHVQAYRYAYDTIVAMHSWIQAQGA